MEGLPEKAAAAQSLRKPSPFVSGSPYHYNTCYRSSGRSRMFKLRLGLGFQTYARIPLFGALWAHVGLDSFVSSFSYSSSSASSSSSLCLRLHPPRYAPSLSLSLSLATTSRGLCISLYLLCASPLECPCHKTEAGSKLTAP